MGKAIVDSQFAELLFEKPEEAIKDYSLTEEEFEKVERVSEKVGRKAVSEIAVRLDERIAKSVPCACCGRWVA